MNSKLQASTFCARLLAVAVCALLGWSAWARGGTVVALQTPLPWIGLAILSFLAIDRLGHIPRLSLFKFQLSAFRSQPSLSSPRPTAHGPRSTGVLFWAGLAFLVLLTVQWWNAGRQPYFHPFDQRWVFTPPPHPGWPWAVDRNDAAEMLRWFFPAWALMLALRCTTRPAWLAKRVAWFMIINAGLLATFGIVQTLSGTRRIFWTTPLSNHFFASFGYENHAASYFALLFALSAGMLLHRLSAGQRPGVSAFTANCQLPTANCPPHPHTPTPPHILPVALATSAICAVLCLAGMALSFSRAGLGLAVGLSGVVLILAVRLFWGRVSIAQRVAVVAALLMGVATVFFVVASMGGVQLAQAGLALLHLKWPDELNARLFMIRSALQMWSDNPWFGVGGWGFRHFVPVYAAGIPSLRLGAGDANTHNDAVQFLCEFGTVGFGLILAATVTFAWPLLWRVRRQLTPGLVLVCLGLVAVLFHSLIDLPFRSPGILYAWLAVCGVATWAGGMGGCASGPQRFSNETGHGQQC